MKEEKEIRFEIKTNIINIIKTVEKAGFKKHSDFLIKDKYYDTEKYTLVKNKEGYRCRIIENKNDIFKELTYKKKVGNSVYEENMEIGNFCKKIKDKKKVITINKQRIIYNKDGDNVVIDVIKDLGNFLEIECEENNPQEIFEKLFLNPRWIKRTHLGITEIWLNKYEKTKYLTGKKLLKS